MIQNENIIYFSSDEWENSLKTSQFHVAVRLARENRVLYVNSIGMRNPEVSKKDVSRVVNKLKRCFRGIKKIHENMYVASPIVIPFHGSGFVKRINKILLIIFIKYCQWRLHLKRPIVLTFLPNVVPIIRSFGEKCIIYYCADQMASFKGAPVSIVEMEKTLLKQADLIFATSRLLYEDKKRFNKNTYYLPHGVDADLFNKALHEETPIPEDMKNIPKPVIGFFGLICSEWVDMELLTFIAAAHPEWSVVLIGRISNDVDIPALKKWKNIHLLGPRQYENLPGYCKAFDAAVIPFKLTELGKNVNPLKLREYLAAGVPVVSTPLPELDAYSKVIGLADNHAGFTALLESAVKENDIRSRIKRGESVKGESWDAKFETISEIISTHLR